MILTSGTTGTPKGAPRNEPKSLGLIGGLLSKVPFRARETTELAVPMFHALGFACMALGLALGSTLVVRRHFDPEATLDSLEDNEATALIVVPVMLQRILELGDRAVAQRDLSNLRVIFVSGSALSIDLVKRSLKAFGPVLYNMYGSTEIAYATIATPKDLGREPGSVGTVVRGVVVKIFDDDGAEVKPGATGRIFVGNAAQFEGYTGGETKEQIKGLMSSGDVGHFDAKGRLFIDGRDDEMIVSGGENVFPAEVEELLAGHEAIDEAAVIGVDDEKFGQRLKAFVVVRSGQTLDEDTVKAYVKDNLARYKTPREVVFLDELPRNPTGKVLKRELEESGDGDGGDGARPAAPARSPRPSRPRGPTVQPQGRRPAEPAQPQVQAVRAAKVQRPRPRPRPRPSPSRPPDPTVPRGSRGASPRRPSRRRRPRRRPPRRTRNRLADIRAAVRLLPGRDLSPRPGRRTSRASGRDRRSGPGGGARRRSPSRRLRRWRRRDRGHGARQPGRLPLGGGSCLGCSGTSAPGTYR